MQGNALVINHKRAPYQNSNDSMTPVWRPAYNKKSFLRPRVVPVEEFHGARTAFCRLIEGKLTSAGHRTILLKIEIVTF